MLLRSLQLMTLFFLSVFDVTVLSFLLGPHVCPYPLTIPALRPVARVTKVDPAVVGPMYNKLRDWHHGVSARVLNVQ